MELAQILFDKESAEHAKRQAAKVRYVELLWSEDEPTESTAAELVEITRLLDISSSQVERDCNVVGELRCIEGSDERHRECKQAVESLKAKFSKMQIEHQQAEREHRDRCTKLMKGIAAAEDELRRAESRWQDLRRLHRESEDLLPPKR